MTSGHLYTVNIVFTEAIVAGSDASWALVTGASSGLGIEFAKALAARGTNVILSARSEPAMQRLADELRRKHRIEVVVEALDLSQPGSADTLRQRLDTRGIEPAIVINNAGFGLSGAFLDGEAERLRAMLQLNIISLTEISQIFGRRMAARGGGHILLVASMAAYQPNPMLAAYGASKAYVLSLGEALNVELAPKVGVTVLSPGVMDTGFNDVSGFETPSAIARTKLPPAQVARIGLDALFAGKPGVVAGRLNRLLSLSSRFMSRHMAAKVTYNMSGGARQARG